MWDGGTPADASGGFGIQRQDSPGNPFESLWTFSIPSEVLAHAESRSKHAKASHGSIVPPSSSLGSSGKGKISGFAGKSVCFKTTIFQYSKDLVSVQCTLHKSSGREEA
eukprot:CAMPEP_0197493448 /NCGR_PEP_ID=MMETSP1311-20131121/21938_1 /TAXON_ID=464262 /ORGANISM="Genus nov. species nov., Strain RCC856" /LENGTH=108 /DNA_ID=CAMNT_0043038687 /DNA_START=1 /DNA_END=323 /DNA_ORIENTATION=+